MAFSLKHYLAKHTPTYTSLFLISIVCGISLLWHKPVANANELSDLKAQLLLLQKQMQTMQGQMSTLQTQIETLDKQGQADQPTPSGSQETLAALREDIDLIEEEQAYLSQTLADRLQANLYATLEFENFNDSDASFDARNVELLLAAQMNQRLHAFAEIEFERVAQTSGNRAGEVEVEQGWLQYDIHPSFNPRFGVVLVPFGRFNDNHFDVRRDLTDRPIALRRVIPSTWAEAGAGFVGQLNVAKLGLAYQAYLVNGLSNDLNDHAGLRNARGAFGKDNNNNKALVGRIGFTPSYSFEFGFSGYYGGYDEQGHKVRGLDLDWKYQAGPFELLGELAEFRLYGGGLQADGLTRVPRRLAGGYIQTNLHFWPKFLNGSWLTRNFSDPAFTAVLRYGQALIEDDGDTGQGDNRESRWTLGLNYRPVESWVFKLEYQWNQTANEALERGDKDGFIGSVSAAF